MRRLIALVLASLLVGAPVALAKWQSVLQVTEGGGGGGFSLTYESSAQTSSNALTTVNFGTMTYGSGNTRVVAAISYCDGSNTPIISVTIGGVLSTVVSGTFGTDGNSGTTAIWETNSAPSGSSGNVIVVFGASLCGGRTNAASIALYNLQTTTPTASAGNQISQSGTVTNSITVPAGGGAIALMEDQNGNTFTGWTNATADNAISGSVSNYVGHTTSTGSVSVSAGISPSSTMSLSLAAWGP